MAHCVVGASYVRDNGPQVVLMLRSESGERSQLRFPYSPYFFINQNDLKLFKEVAPTTGLEKFTYQTGYHGVDGAKLLKVIVSDPYVVGAMNKAVLGTEIKLYESNIPFHSRFMIDKGYMTGIDVSTRLPVECESRHRIVYIDIEMLADKAPEEPMYPIVVVGIYDSQTRVYHSIFVGSDFSINLEVLKTEPRAVVRYPCRTEEELYSIFAQLWSRIEPDVVVSFSPFDMTNIVKRMNILGIDVSFLSPIFNVVSRDRLHIHCVEIVDYAELYRKVFGEPVWNTLDYISNKELGYGKLPMPSVVEGWKNNYRGVVEYNLRDVELLKDLEDKLGLIQDYLLFIWRNTGLSFSDCLIPNRIGDILHLRHVAGKEIFLSVSDRFGRRYTGALVVCDKPGLYENVVVFDWNELYPGIMDAFHMSYDSFNPFGDIQVMEGVGFTSTVHGTTNEIMVPLRKHRQEVKAMAKAASPEDKHRYKMFNAAIKVIINGLYGLYGQKTKTFTSRFYDPRIAGAITFVGRDILVHAKQILGEIGYHLVYADSVRANTPMVIRRNGKLEIIPIKEARVGDETITEKGWTTIFNVIPKEVKKRMYRIETYDGVVEVTEDHSLVNNEYLPKYPKDIIKGETLGYFEYNLVTIEEKVDEDIAWLLGYFVADGTAGDYRTTCKKVSVHFDSQDISLIKKTKTILEKAGFKSSVSSYPSNITAGGMVHRLNVLSPVKSKALEYFMMCYNEEHEKIIPKIILNSSKNSMKHFLEGYLDGDGSNKNKENIWKATDTALVIFGLHILAKKIGLKSRYEVYNGQRRRRDYLRNIRFVRDINDKRLHKDSMVKKVTDIGINEEIVYDLETDNHHFSAGGILLHNTDSLFIQLKGTENEVEYLRNAIQDGIFKYVKDRYHIDSKFRLDLEYIFKKVMILAKKRYHGITFSGEKIVKGLNIVRKDVASITVVEQEKVGDMRLSGVPVPEIHRYILDLYNAVSNGKVPLKDIAVMGRCSKSQYAVVTRNQKAVEYANRREIDIGVGERFYWIYLKPVEQFIVPAVEKKDKPKIIEADVIAFKDPDKFPKGLVIDYKRMADYTIRSPLMPYIGSEKDIKDRRLTEYFG